MDQGFTGSQFTTVYDGSHDNNNLYYLAEGLTNGLYYTFRAYSVNFNGVSLEPSQTVSYWACTAPTGLEKAQIVSQTPSALQISWASPKDNGGCRVTGFVIYRDDGQGGDISTEVNSVSDVQVRDLPSLNTFEVTDFPADSSGRTFRF